MDNNSREDQIKKMIFKIRKEKKFPISICREAIEEANLDEKLTMEIVIKKCMNIGEKYIDNPDKILTNNFVYCKKKDKSYYCVKIGTQSEFSGCNSDIINLSKKFIDNIDENKEYLSIDNNQEIDDYIHKHELKKDILFLGGLLRENIKILFIGKITSEYLYLSKKNTIEESNDFFISNSVLLFSSSTFLEKEIVQSIMININFNLKKNKKKIELEKFYESFAVDNKKSTIKELLNGSIINNILVV
ncbi:hypothetical protein AB836_02140 [Rickettsiales bacterium (ex Bugula neritina AB1)]|nr:hypothetical protein AB836_02140 [Rickettsiales bacterium (ex Bugula neritina AB1)]